MNPFKFITNLFLWKKPPAAPNSKVVWVDSFSKVPKDTGTKIFVVGTTENKKWVVFMCPNGCGRRVEVNLMRSRNPNWKVTLKSNKLSLWPSIIVDECGAHFWLEKNRIVWSRDDSQFD